MNEEAPLIRRAEINDTSAISAIYEHYVKNTIITFDLEPFNRDKFEHDVRLLLSSFPFFVSELNNQVCGYAYAAPWKTRRAYDQTVESSVYLKSGYEGQGIGQSLYKELFKELKSKSIRVVIAGISLPNDESVRFHEKFGFEHSGTFKEVGFKFARWIDVGYWQLKL